jgi:hypothetical protein
MSFTRGCVVWNEPADWAENQMRRSRLEDER